MKLNYFIAIQLFLVFSLLHAEKSNDNFYKPYNVFHAPERYRWFAINENKEFRYPYEKLTFFKDGIDKKSVEVFIEDYINHLQRVLEEKGLIDHNLKIFFEKNIKIRKDFLLALSPEYDNHKKAIEVFNILKKKDEKIFLKFYQLAIAFAVVYDNDDAVISSRFSHIWGFELDQFQKTQTYEELFAFYTHLSSQKYMHFKPEKLKWPFLVHVVDTDTNIEEMMWARKKYQKNRKKIPNSYYDITYDEQKLDTKQPNLWKVPYNIMNILKYNGICGDQSHYSTRIAKTFCIPAMKVSGAGRYGGYHSWGGFLTAINKKPRLKFIGRYRGDHYYTGDVFDPQTRTFVLDRSLAMLMEGVDRHYGNFMLAQLLGRISYTLREVKPNLAFKLCKYGLSLNSYAETCWEVIFRLIKNKKVSRSDSVEVMNQLFKGMKRHPDIAYKGLKALITSTEDTESKLRQSFYKKLHSYWSKRPDLEIKMRILQCNEMRDNDDVLEVLKLALNTCLFHVKESKLILPLIDIVVKITVKNNMEKKVVPYLKKINNKFPKKRYNRPARAYGDFRKIVSPIVKL